MHLAVALAAAIAAQPVPPMAAGTAVLACAMPAPSGAATSERIFEVGQGALREWNPVDRTFGRDLCKAFQCVKTATRSEGSVMSASVAYTIGLDHQTGQGYWRVVGASGLKVTEGACRRIAAPGTGD